jgi:hypothetical protein
LDRTSNSAMFRKKTASQLMAIGIGRLAHPHDPKEHVHDSRPAACHEGNPSEHLTSAEIDDGRAFQ